MIECYGICSEKCAAMQNGKCVLDAKKAEGANDIQLYKEDEEKHDLTLWRGERMADIKDFKEALKLAIDLSEETSTKMVMLDLFDVFYSAAYSDGQRYMIDEHSCAEVVRCKDCRYGQYCTDGETTYQCFKWNSGEFGVLHEQGWYCADGERKEG